MTGKLAREISYASSAQTRAGRVLIRLMENATGRLSLIRRARGYAEEVARGEDFWRVMVDRYGLGLDVVGGSLEDIPVRGPLVLVANHPYGILDGLIMGYLLSAIRGDFRLLAPRVFRRAAELDRVILPVNFDATPEAVRENLRVRADALSYLCHGGAIGIFPGGTVSTSAGPFGRPMDPVWRNFTARMIARSDATVVPIYFDGANSRLFQLASHLHFTLRMGLLIREFRQRIDRPVRLSVGRPIAARELAALRGDSKAMMDFLRRATYELSPGPVASIGYGYEFEDRYRA